jgi:hypothetical protein
MPCCHGWRRPIAGTISMQPSVLTPVLTPVPARVLTVVSHRVCSPHCLPIGELARTVRALSHSHGIGSSAAERIESIHGALRAQQRSRNIPCWLTQRRAVWYSRPWRTAARRTSPPPHGPAITSISPLCAETYGQNPRSVPVGRYYARSGLLFCRGRAPWARRSSCPHPTHPVAQKCDFRRKLDPDVRVICPRHPAIKIGFFAKRIRKKCAQAGFILEKIMKPRICRDD